MRRRFFKVFAGTIIVLLFVVLVIPVVRAAFLTPFLFVNIAVQEGAWRPLELLTREPKREERRILSSSGRQLDLDIYLPPGSRQRPSILMYVPLAGGGQRDARLVNIAESLARTGFVVMVPWYREHDGILGRDDVEDIISAFQFLIAHDRVDSTRSGIFAISYGNGPAFLAAADERIKNDVEFIFSYAGYYDLIDAMHYVVSGQYSYGEIDEYLEPEQWVRNLARDNLLSLGLTENEVAMFFKEPDRFDELMAERPGLRAKMTAFSPMSVLDQINSTILIAHSTGDRTIPYTESLKLYDALKDRVPTTISIVNFFVHGETVPITPASVFKNYLPSFVSGNRLLYELLIQ